MVGAPSTEMGRVLYAILLGRPVRREDREWVVAGRRGWFATGKAEEARRGVRVPVSAGGGGERERLVRSSVVSSMSSPPKEKEKEDIAVVCLVGCVVVGLFDVRKVINLIPA